MEKNCKSRLKMASQGILNITPSGAKSKHLEKWERLVFRILLEFNLVLLFAKFANFKYILDIWSNWEASASADCQDMFSIWKLPKAKPTRCNSLPPHPSTSSPRSPTTSSTSSGNWATATATVVEFVFQNYLGVLPASNAYSPELLDFGMQLPTIQIQIQMLLKCTLFVGVKFQSNPNLIDSSLVIFPKQYLRWFLWKNVVGRAWDEGSSS